VDILVAVYLFFWYNFFSSSGIDPNNQFGEPGTTESINPSCSRASMDEMFSFGPKGQKK